MSSYLHAVVDSAAKKVFLAMRTLTLAIAIVVYSSMMVFGMKEENPECVVVKEDDETHILKFVRTKTLAVVVCFYLGPLSRCGVLILLY